MTKKELAAREATLKGQQGAREKLAQTREKGSKGKNHAKA